MNRIGAISFSNFRSFEDVTTVPFNKKITFLAGKNNSGKSNILRFVAFLVNDDFQQFDDKKELFSSTAPLAFSLSISSLEFSKFFFQAKQLTAIIEKLGDKNFVVSGGIGNNGIEVRSAENQPLFKMFGGDYFNSQLFSRDFGRSGGEVANQELFLSKIVISNLLSGTNYLPSNRLITSVDQNLPIFDDDPFKGETLAFGSVIEHYAKMSSPEFESYLIQREKLEKICDFIAYSLDKKNVKIEVPESKKTIIVTIDGNSQRLSNLGSGIHQLLMIGLASMGFAKKIVLIDEPEANLHPRAQKKIMNYLDKNVDVQFLIATHSAAILDSVDADILHVEHNGRKSSSVHVQSNLQRYDTIRDLGHTPSELIQTNYAIWVEGPSDRIYLNFWISKIAPKLIEGVDYAILFYGGRILSHHSFEDYPEDYVKAISLSRAFAVIMDSDRKELKTRLGTTKIRVRKEIEKSNGLCWITDGREIENYIPQDIVSKLKNANGVKIPKTKYDKVLVTNTAKKADKVEFAREAVKIEWKNYPLDLEKQIKNLVKEILLASNEM